MILPGPSPLESPHFDELHVGLGRRLRRQVERPLFDTARRLHPRVGDPRPPRLVLRRRHRGRRSTSRRSTTAGSPTLCHMYGRRPRGHPAALRPRRPRADDRPAGPHGPVGRPLRRGPRRADAREDQGRHPRHRPRPDGAARSTRSSARRRARSSWRPPYIVGDLPRLRAALDRDPDGYVLVSRRHLRSKNSWMHNVEGAGEGQGPLHAARPPRRRQRARPASTASRPGSPARPAPSRCRSRSATR